MSARHGVRAELLASPPALVPIADLGHYPGNAREHDGDVLQESLATHGQYAPLLVQRSTGYVLIGNGRLDAALALGWTHVLACHIDCDDEQALRINLMDNRASKRGRTNPADERAQLERLAGDFLGTGYEQRDLDRLTRELDTPLRFPDEPLRTSAGLREAVLTLPASDHAELLALFTAIKAATTDAPQGQVALLAARVAVAVLDGGAGHRPDCTCDWCSIARQAGAR